MKKMHIAILGANSQVARVLIRKFLEDKDFCLHLFTRSSARVEKFVASVLGDGEHKSYFIYSGYHNFADLVCDTIINCVGVGTQSKLKGDYTRWFTVTEKFDNLIIDYLSSKSPETLYISLSSGIVYGRDLTEPAVEDFANCLCVNNLNSEDYYTVVRLNAETKHRAFNSLKIIDLRLFSFFSRFIDLTDGYFITEILKSVRQKKVFLTNKVNMIRDYVHPDDFFTLIKKCMTAGQVNDVYDVVSSQPVKKFDILDYFSKKYGLEYEIADLPVQQSATGIKNIYCSSFNKAVIIGYQPRFSSMDAIKDESRHILVNNR